MGTTLTGTTPQDTYDSLIKVTDNGPLSGTAKYLSDGLGNDSILALSTARVGLGTNVPSAMLTLNATEPFIRIERSGVPTWQIQNNTLSVDAGFSINNLTNAGTPFFINGTTNNVGIGTSTPAATLDVVGSSSSELGALRLFNSRVSGAEQQSVSILMRNQNTVGNFPSVKLIAQESTTDSNLGQFIVQASNDNSATLVEVFRTAPAGAGGAPFLRMASGTGGIQFNGDTAAANALDDYEEGTWTMGVTFGGAAVGVTYGANTGTYTKIGRQVTVNGYLALTSKGSSTGNAFITGLPFTIFNNSAYYACAAVRLNGVTFANQYQGFGEINTTTIKLENLTEAGVVSNLTNTNFSDTTDLIISLTYFV
jgi:hypothetical protein